VVNRQNADIADTLHLRDVAMTTTFWLSMGYNFPAALCTGGGFSDSTFQKFTRKSILAGFSICTTEASLQEF